jgi:hypothetical protein
MLAVERPGGADRERHSMQRQGIARAELREEAMRPPTLSHVVLRVDLEEIHAVRAGESVLGVFGLEADADICPDKALNVLGPHRHVLILRG